MVKILLLDSNSHQPIQEWNFPSQSIIKIGRLPDNDVIFGDYLEVSRYHLELRQISPGSPSQSQWLAISKGANGTFVNGILFSQGDLKDNDLIQLSQHGPLLKFEKMSNPNIKPTNSPEKKQSLSCNHSGNPTNSIFCIHCGQPIVEQEEFILHYQILRPLGRGGMGSTYLAWDKTGKTTGTPRLLVLKEMNADMALIAKARELFEREARILKSLNHCGVPKYYDFFIENSKKYLAMELIHGQNLEQRIYEKGPAQPEQAIGWMIQVCNILSYLHSLEPKPLVHRDVKPANLMVRNLDNSIVLLDFGAVKEIGTPQGTVIGAEGYSAPEQIRGKPCPQSDLFAIGPTLIFLLTGALQIKNRLLLGNDYKFDLSKVNKLNPKLGKVIEKTCQSKIQDRYQTGQELAQALKDCL